MEATVFIITGAMALILGAAYHRVAKKKRILHFLEKGYGRKPEERAYELDEIRILWKELDDKKEGMDEITWNDLDMDDVFRRINVCNSSLGEQVLYRCIRRSPHDCYFPEEVDSSVKKEFTKRCQDGGDLEFLERQAAFFAENSRVRQQVQKSLFGFGKRKGNYYVPMFLNNLDSFQLKAAWIYAGLHVLLLAAFFLALLLRTTLSYSLLGIVILVNLCVYTFMKGKYEIHLDSIACMNNIAQMCIEFAKFDGNGVFCRLEPYKKLAKRIKKSALFMNVRHQQTYTADFMEVCAIYLMGAFLLDFIFFNKMIRLLEKNLACIWEMFFAVGQIDMAIALASYRESLPVWCVPEISGDGGLDYREVYNPLLDHPVYNDFRLESNCMITGSNASGKSTFMKAVAVNEILAFSIHTCSAKRAVIPKMEVYTSMAVRDDLLAGESYFIKEIKSLRRIVRRVEKAGKILIVIDEILRGTNTRERVAASAAILKYLGERNCMVIVASHDMELAGMLKEHTLEMAEWPLRARRRYTYRNYYFCEKETEGVIEFDYKIHEGICMQTNAIKLLEHFEFPRDIVEDACAALVK